MTGPDETSLALQTIEGERLRRYREHWDSAPLTSGEVSRLRLRLLRDASVPPRLHAGRLRWGMALALGGLLAAGTTLAALGGVPWLQAPAGPGQAQPAPIAAPGEKPALGVQGRGDLLAEQEATPEPASEQVPLEAPAIQETPAQASSAPKQRSAAEPGTKAAASWADARDALRRDDLSRAEQTLSELSRSGDAFSRDSAALSLAELRIKQGRPEEARPLLTRLSREGHTAHIRERAASLLR